jgi:hypothetical protein
LRGRCRISKICGESGGLGAVGHGQEAGSATGGSSGCGAERLLTRVRSGRGVWRGRWDYRRRSRIHGSAGVGLYFDANQVLIGDFPAEVLVLAALFEVLLEEDGAAGIGDEDARSRQKDIASAILHLHATPEKGGVASHPAPSVGGS